MVYFLVPVYNEVSNLKLLAQNFKSALPTEDKCFVFSDDGSSDDSLTLIDQLFKGTTYKILGDGQNYGPGHAFKVGFNWILENSEGENDIVVTLEADNTSDINLLPKMVTISRLGYELVLASVYAQSGGFDKTSFMRKFLSFSANMVFRSFFNVKVLTLSSFYRVYHVNMLRRVQDKYEQLIEETGFICKLEILLKSIRCGAQIIEVPMVLHSSKREGKSKMKVFKTTKDYIRFLLFKRLK